MARDITAFRYISNVGGLQFLFIFFGCSEIMFYQNRKCSKENYHHKLLAERQLRLLSLWSKSDYWNDISHFLPECAPCRKEILTFEQIWYQLSLFLWNNVGDKFLHPCMSQSTKSSAVVHTHSRVKERERSVSSLSAIYICSLCWLLWISYIDNIKDLLWSRTISWTTEKESD